MNILTAIGVSIAIGILVYLIELHFQRVPALIEGLIGWPLMFFRQRPDRNGSRRQAGRRHQQRHCPAARLQPAALYAVGSAEAGQSQPTQPLP